LKSTRILIKQDVVVIVVINQIIYVQQVWWQQRKWRKGGIERNFNVCKELCRFPLRW